jgi:hypothetical protein
MPTEPDNKTILNKNDPVRTPASIGTLRFRYSDPSVSVSTELKTKEFETIDDEIVIQALGRRAKEYTVNAVVSTTEATVIDNLPQMGEVTLTTDRTGTVKVLVMSTNTTFRREKDVDGFWLHDATINCMEAGEPTTLEPREDDPGPDFGPVVDPQDIINR